MSTPLAQPDMMPQGYGFTLAEQDLIALPQGALWWAEQRLLCVSDLHLGKAERHLRRGGGALPPYEGEETLSRLETLLADLRPKSVICLGDSFDDSAAAQALPPEIKSRIAALVAGHDWIWIEGNHDPQPSGFPGRHLPELTIKTFCFRHIADPGFAPSPSVGAEISGHFHPKAGLRGVTRPAFLVDRQRLILPAFGTYTGGLRSTDPALTALMAPEALAILTGAQALAMPMPRKRRIR